MKENIEKLVEVLNKSMLPLVKSLTDDEAVTTFEYEQGESTLIVRIKTSKSEIGKILGQGGKTVNALRTLLYRLSGKYRLRALLEVIE